MTTSRMPDAREPNPGARRPRPSRRGPGARRSALLVAAGGAAALSLLLVSCAAPGGGAAPAGSAGAPPAASGPSAATRAPGAGSAEAVASVPAVQPPGTSIVSGSSGAGSVARLTVVVDAAHSWISAKADLANTALEGRCEFVLERGAQAGEHVGAQTARILSTREGAHCSGASFPVGEPGEYRVTVSVPDASGGALSVSTVVEFPAAG